MSNLIDNRIVNMQFNNTQFESGVKTSVKSLDNLKRGLNLDGAASGLTNLQKVGNAFSLAGMEEGLNNLSSKFSTMGLVGVTALMNITNSAINAGKQLISSLTIDPISDGFADYNRKLTSVQTIMNATGKDIDTVGGYFSQLDTYADKTIYNLDDMTSSFAKFTNAGVDMDKSVPAIKGIANMVALAGQDAGAAQIAMYNLSQSIAGGFLTRMDFKSLELANVATKEWKDQMIQGAVAAGTLTETSEGMFLAKGAKEAVSSTALFVDELSKGWATSEVMLGVLGQYGDETTAIGGKAQSAAQDVKSFSMMMDTLKASVGTGWTDTFEILVGNLIEAKALFTPLTNTIGGFLDASSNARNSLLQGWKDLGGRTALIDTIKNSFTEVMRIVTVIGGAFREIFPAITADQLFKITDKLKELTARLKLSDETLGNVKSVFKGLFAILDIGKTLLLSLAKAIGIVFGGVGNLGASILNIAGSFGDWLVSVDAAIKESKIFDSILTTLAYGFKNVLNAISYVIDMIITAVSKVKNAIADKIDFSGFDGFGSALGSLSTNISEFPQLIIDSYNSLVNVFKEKIYFPGLEMVQSFLDLIHRRMTNISEVSGGVADKVTSAFGDMGNSAEESKSKMSSNSSDMFDKVWDTVKKYRVWR